MLQPTICLCMQGLSVPYSVKTLSVQIIIYEITDTGVIRCAKRSAPAAVDSMQLNSCTLLLLSRGESSDVCEQCPLGVMSLSTPTAVHRNEGTVMRQGVMQKGVDFVGISCGHV